MVICPFFFLCSQKKTETGSSKLQTLFHFWLFLHRFFAMFLPCATFRLCTLQFPFPCVTKAVETSTVLNSYPWDQFTKNPGFYNRQHE